MTTHLPVVQATAIYEDLEAGIRAKALMDCVQSGLDLPAEFKVDLWRFDWLSELSMRNMALTIAKNSTLVLISASTNTPFPVEMERWMRAWMQSRENQLSAIVLLAPEEANPVAPYPLREALQRVAQQKRVELHCEFFKPSHAEPGSVVIHRRELDEVFRPRDERPAILPAIVTGVPSARTVGLPTRAPY